MEHRYDQTSSRKRMRRVLGSGVAACLAMALGACADDPFVGGQSQMVVEGWIEDGAFPVVILTRTLPVSTDFVSMDHLGDYIVKWAKVTVSDGQDSVVLTGKYDDRYFPPYIYTTGRMRGKAGSTYRLTVEEDDVVAMAVTTIPQQAPQVAFKVEQRLPSDSLYQITACLTDPADSRDYYQLFSRVGGRTLQYSAAFLGSLSDVTLATYSEIPVYRGKSLTDSLHYTPYFEPGDSVSVKVAAIDEQAFSFWSDFSKNISLSSNLFLAPSTNIRSHVVGAWGCWYGMNAVEQRFVIAQE
ncbi:MAG: DUF4249 domain-containing protein [Prevotella sp.]